MGELPLPQIGDWVAFFRDSRIVYAEVRYVDRLRYDGILTTLGAVSVGSILEIRSP